MKTNELSSVGNTPSNGEAHLEDRLDSIEKKLDELKEYLDDIYEKISELDIVTDLGIDFES